MVSVLAHLVLLRVVAFLALDSLALLAEEGHPPLFGLILAQTALVPTVEVLLTKAVPGGAFVSLKAHIHKNSALRHFSGSDAECA